MQPTWRNRHGTRSTPVTSSRRPPCDVIVTSFRDSSSACGRRRGNSEAANHGELSPVLKRRKAYFSVNTESNANGVNHGFIFNHVGHADLGMRMLCRQRWMQTADPYPTVTDSPLVTDKVRRQKPASRSTSFRLASSLGSLFNHKSKRSAKDSKSSQASTTKKPSMLRSLFSRQAPPVGDLWIDTDQRCNWDVSNPLPDWMSAAGPSASARGLQLIDRSTSRRHESFACRDVIAAAPSERQAVVRRCNSACPPARRPTSQQNALPRDDVVINHVDDESGREAGFRQSVEENMQVDNSEIRGPTINYGDDVVAERTVAVGQMYQDGSTNSYLQLPSCPDLQSDGVEVLTASRRSGGSTSTGSTNDPTDDGRQDGSQSLNRRFKHKLTSINESGQMLAMAARSMPSVQCAVDNTTTCHLHRPASEQLDNSKPDNNLSVDATKPLSTKDWLDSLHRSKRLAAALRNRNSKQVTAGRFSPTASNVSLSTESSKTRDSLNSLHRKKKLNTGVDESSSNSSIPPNNPYLRSTNATPRRTPSNATTDSNIAAHRTPSRCRSDTKVTPPRNSSSSSSSSCRDWIAITIDDDDDQSKYIQHSSGSFFSKVRRAVVDGLGALLGFSRHKNSDALTDAAAGDVIENSCIISYDEMSEIQKLSVLANKMAAQREQCRSLVHCNMFSMNGGLVPRSPTDVRQAADVSGRVLHCRTNVEKASDMDVLEACFSGLSMTDKCSSSSYCQQNAVDDASRRSMESCLKTHHSPGVSCAQSAIKSSVSDISQTLIIDEKQQTVPTCRDTLSSSRNCPTRQDKQLTSGSELYRVSRVHRSCSGDGFDLAKNWKVPSGSSSSRPRQMTTTDENQRQEHTTSGLKHTDDTTTKTEVRSPCQPRSFQRGHNLTTGQCKTAASGQAVRVPAGNVTVTVEDYSNSKPARTERVPSAPAAHVRFENVDDRPTFRPADATVLQSTTAPTKTTTALIKPKVPPKPAGLSRQSVSVSNKAGNTDKSSQHEFRFDELRWTLDDVSAAVEAEQRVNSRLSDSPQTTPTHYQTHSLPRHVTSTSRSKMAATSGSSLATSDVTSGWCMLVSGSDDDLSSSTSTLTEQTSHQNQNSKIRLGNFELLYPADLFNMTSDDSESVTSVESLRSLGCRSSLVDTALRCSLLSQSHSLSAISDVLRASSVDPLRTPRASSTNIPVDDVISRPGVPKFSASLRLPIDSMVSSNSSGFGSLYDGRSEPNSPF